eukprot:GHVQ01030900.1.p1 GENE.GHVQ01030900.1~~GHVQ01030900.1.p1  ORF type:complete len:267 (+),score=23.10 GHVQ01030900.1:145-945(+)
MREVVEVSKRFQIPTGNQDVAHLLTERDRLLHRVHVADFDKEKWANEEYFEDWLDKISPVIRNIGVSPALFRQVLLQKLPAVMETAINATSVSDYEDIIDETARRVYPESRLFSEMETAILNATSKDTTMEAQDHYAHTIGRYARSCKRRGRFPITNNHVLKDFAVKLVPVMVKSRIKEKSAKLSVEEIFKKAARLESALKEVYGVPKVYEAFPVNSDFGMREPESEARRSEPLPDLRGQDVPYGRCYACGGKHRKDTAMMMDGRP